MFLRGEVTALDLDLFELLIETIFLLSEASLTLDNILLAIPEVTSSFLDLSACRISSFFGSNDD